MNGNAVNIIVVGYKVPKIEHACVGSIIKNTNYPYLLTFFDNYGSGLSLTEVWNFLIDKSPLKYVCLLNSDTIVYPGWLKKLIDPLGSDKKIAFVGPSTNNCHSPQKRIATYEEATKYEGKIEIMKDPISGFCLVFRKALWTELGGFNPKYKLYGQESDFIDRAQRLGYKVAWRKDAFVYHKGEASVNAHKYDADKERKIARKLYWADRGKKI